jgi:precorrin isomerase
MAEEPKGKPPAKDWRLAIIIGVPIGFAMPMSQAIQKALEPSMGYWGAVLVSVVAAAFTAGLVALVIAWLLWRGGGGRA